MTTLRTYRHLAALVVVTMLSSVATACVANRSSAESPTDAQRQVAASLRTQLENPEFKLRYLVHQHFMDLYNRMPTFDRANFGPSVRTVYWRSVKWHMQGIFESPDGKLYVRLEYGAGPGLNQEYTAQLYNGHYVGHVSLDWDSLSRDPRYRTRVVPWNTLPLDCRDVHGSTTPFAAIPSRPGGPTVTKKALYAASGGVSTLPGVTIGCYQFAGLHLIQLGNALDAVLFRIEGKQLVPVVRGSINYADQGGHFIVVHGTFAGYDSDGLPLNDYLEATVSR